MREHLCDSCALLHIPRRQRSREELLGAHTGPRRPGACAAGPYLNHRAGRAPSRPYIGPMAALLDVTNSQLCQPGSAIKPAMAAVETLAHASQPSSSPPLDAAAGLSTADLEAAFEAFAEERANLAARTEHAGMVVAAALGQLRRTEPQPAAVGARWQAPRRQEAAQLQRRDIELEEKLQRALEDSQALQAQVGAAAGPAQGGANPCAGGRCALRRAPLAGAGQRAHPISRQGRPSLPLTSVRLSRRPADCRVCASTRRSQRHPAAPALHHPPGARGS